MLEIFFFLLSISLPIIFGIITVVFSIITKQKSYFLILVVPIVTLILIYQAMGYGGYFLHLSECMRPENIQYNPGCSKPYDWSDDAAQIIGLFFAIPLALLNAIILFFRIRINNKT